MKNFLKFWRLTATGLLDCCRNGELEFLEGNRVALNLMHDQIIHYLIPAGARRLSYLA